MLMMVLFTVGVWPVKSQIIRKYNRMVSFRILNSPAEPKGQYSWSATFAKL